MPCQIAVPPRQCFQMFSVIELIKLEDKITQFEKLSHKLSVQVQGCMKILEVSNLTPKIRGN